MKTILERGGQDLMNRKELSGLGKRLKEVREAAGLSQQALAVRAGLSISVVSRLEQGAQDNPRLHTIKAIADALGVTVDDLLREERPASPADEDRPPEKKPARTK